MKNLKILLGAVCGVALLYSCQDAGGNQTGSEFIPDMVHSVAYEANYRNDYSLNSFEKESVVGKRSLESPRLPVKGTIPRGYSGNYTAGSENGVTVHPNGHVPYYYADTEEERIRANAEIVTNPFPISTAGLNKGKELYNIYCGICHGEKADGGGYLVRDDGGKYPAAPANFLLDTFVNSNNGRFYHGIMYGKNVMGGYADKLSYEERWQVIHYIRSLQAKAKKLEYSELANTFGAGGTPLALQPKPMAPVMQDSMPSEKPKKEGHSTGGH